MACRESAGSKILLCLGLFVVVTSFCHCASLTRLKALDKFQGQTKRSGLRHGRLLIGQNSLQGAKLKRTEETKDLLEVDSDYQADMGWGGPKQPTVWGDDFSRPNPDSTAVEQLLKMEPEVECTEDSMQLQVRNAASTPGSLFFVDRGRHLSPLPLSDLPPSCGYTIRPTRRDLVLVAPYDGCFVALEEDSYVLLLRWRGLAVRMSCPLMRQSSPNPPMVTCHTEGMVVKTEWTVSVAKINVKLNGSWEQVMKASSSCGFSVVVHPEGLVMSVHYAPCLEEKDGMYTLELTGDGETIISCPSLSPSHAEPTKSPFPKPQDHYPTLKPQLSAVPQVPGLPQTPGISPGKPHQGPKIIPQPQLPYPYFDPNSFYPYHANADIKLTTTVQSTSTTSPVITTTTGQTQKPYYPFPFYVQLPQPITLPTQPPATEPHVKQPAGQPEGQEQKLSYPFVFYPRLPALLEQPFENPVPPKPLFPNKPHQDINHPFYHGPFYHGFSPYDHYQMPMPLKQQTFTSSPQSQTPPRPEAPPAPSAYTQQPQQVTTPSSNRKSTESVTQQPTSGGVSPDFPLLPPMYCPQVCPSRFSNCCLQIAFHQYLHIVPAGLGSKPNGFGSGLGSVHPHQKPAEPLTTLARTTSTSAPISLQTQAPGNKHQYIQPPDGTRVARLRSIPSQFTNLVYLYPSPYIYWLYPAPNEELLHFLQSQLQIPYNVPLIPRAPGYYPFNKMVQFDPYSVQPPKQRNDQPSAGNMNNPTGPYFKSYGGQNTQQQQNKPTAWELQPSNSQFSESLELDHFHVPDYTLQEAQAPAYKKSLVPNSSQTQPLVNTSKEYTEHDQTLHSYSEPKSYMLLQHGPPGRESNSWNESPLPFKDLVDDPNFLAQNLAMHRSNEPQHPQSSPQEQYQQPKWMGNGMSSPLLGNVNYMPRSGDELGNLPLIDPASDGFHFVPLHQDPSTRAARSSTSGNLGFKDLWKPMTPLDSSRGIPLHIPGHFNHGSLQLNTK